MSDKMPPPDHRPSAPRPSGPAASATPSTTDSAGLYARLGRWLTRVGIAALIALGFGVANMAVWDRLNPTVQAPNITGGIAGLAYNAFGRYDTPLEQKFPSYDSVSRDLKLMSGMTHRVRTYSSSELQALPAIAEREGLLLTAGLWIDPREDNAEKEIAALEQAVRTSSAIERVMVGNEQILTAALTPEQIIERLKEVKRRVRKPVSTAEPWHVWLRYPELADHVDFITVHLLPYWEGLPVQQALDYTFERLAEVQKRFPDKHIVIGEVGWPSQGDRRMGSFASPDAQARFIRGFIARAQPMGLDYYLMEAIDQPWKIDNEGRAGPYWGIMHADRTPKFNLDGPIETDPYWKSKAALASAAGALLIFAFLYRVKGLRLVSRLAYAFSIQALATMVVWLVAIPFNYYMRPFDWLFVVILIPSMAAMCAILLTNGYEFVEMFWRGNLSRSFGVRRLSAGTPQPKVSLHLACCNEPPEMVIATIKSLAALDYQNYEVLVIDNNTKDERLWKPVEAFMDTLDGRFKFFHLPSWPGFKAGALNFALTKTAPDADVVGVVDADYIVVTRWLKDLVGHFEDPKVAVVQAPQAHRGWTRQLFRRMMSFEYDGFFRIGMHHRNERDAIIQHGTMTLIRARALIDNGNWSEWCICEDAELGLRLMNCGYNTVYVDQAFGRGLTPDTFLAFKKQRRRWAEGAMQIMRGRSDILFGKSNLTTAQRYHFLSGWFPWIGDALHLLFAFGAMAWSIGIIARPDIFSLPILIFMVPLVIFFFAKALLGPLLYLRRVRCSLADVAGSALAGMALSHGIARGIWSGLINKTAVFEITEKGSSSSTSSTGKAVADAANKAKATQQAAAKAWGGVREEAFLLMGLVAAAIGIAIWRRADHLESAMWITILLLQGVPYAASLICAGLSRIPPHSLSARERREQQMHSRERGFDTLGDNLSDVAAAHTGSPSGLAAPAMSQSSMPGGPMSGGSSMLSDATRK